MVQFDTNPGKMGLEFVPCISAILHSLGERNIDRVPLLPHLIGARVEHALDLIAHILGCGTLAL